MGCLTRRVFSSAAVKSLMYQSGPVATPSTMRVLLREANSGCFATSVVSLKYTLWQANSTPSLEDWRSSSSASAPPEIAAS